MTDKLKMEILRAIVWARSRGYCEKCGTQLPDSWALHHRKLRSRGGKDEVQNFLALHHECHNLGTDSVHLNPSYATDKGYMVHSWEDPRECPVTLPDGSIVTLTPEGSYHYIERQGKW
ncbi:HNH endonuclease [bacterium]|nr:HNH endonuclease [bacterium]